MAINNAANKAKGGIRKQAAKAGSRAAESISPARSSKTAKAAPLVGFQDRASSVRLYVKDADLLKEIKIAALEDDTSLSQLWEDWALEWLRNRR